MSWSESAYISADVRDVRVSSFLGKVYSWMAAGLMLTASTALIVGSSEQFAKTLLKNFGLIWVLGMVQLGMVVLLRTRVDKMAPATAMVVFVVYCTLVGVTSSYIFLAYTATSIVSAFVITGSMFGAMALFGTFTKRSLAGLGQFLYMGLIGLTITSLVSILILNNALIFVIGVVAVFIFTGLTAWDAQRLKELAVVLPEEQLGAHAVVGALSLYLNFINIFFWILRFIGNRRE
jgi:FtsH-binding integral membrane protein